ncbi:MAG: hypothetical protein GY905_01905 [Gammaproteobacteria bacterium]|nr:hypothetical protein [Gammaproteobacteria bacterium]MDP6166419.1 hypothetical protein [Gammaproteobacteria bacterium]
MPPMKPNTRQAMLQLIADIKQVLPFEAPEAQLCSGLCVGCPKKVMAFMEHEVSACEQALTNGQMPSLGEVQQLANTAQKVRKIMLKNQLM